MKVLNLLMRLVMLVFWAGIIYALVGPGFEEAGSMPLILGAVVLVMHVLQMLMLKQVASLLNPGAGDYLEVLVFGSFAMHRHRARLKALSEQQKR
ncbi:DUF1145 domain-containing protein [Oceanimonas sp. NS1]|uniref:DUF1145 domain-containing protein n=1 Tax=Oceanimonas doudoroffii TaxID=84158 RepID=A0A233RDC4_9GAMM|nr:MULTISPECIES: DUF1145 domain-containing protein [Oceanimonas]MCT7654405.1 DUF1145 domain-containing protein [Oceanimonas sp. NS1]NHH99372.1 hypothetical protein [Oceanimonas sp. MB9]OXY81386.1 hypothetical protein B6S08_12925 [Oceanimonas doudoroffii]